ncbi:MAG: urease accessory protein UreF [Nitrospinota bacterium]|nr:urease accessory protein UreF [Nitrospinota bacterium]
MENIQATNIHIAMNIKHTPLVSNDTRLLNLIRLTSPSLPIGAYSYSQGLETAVALGWIEDASSALEWIQGLLTHSLMHLDVPIFKRLYRAWQDDNMEKVHYWSQYLLASRDAFELQEEDRQLGKTMARLLSNLDVEEAEIFLHEPDACLLTLYSLSAVRWNIPLNDAATGLLWMWAENQVLAAIKLVPLGQTAGQKILSQAIEVIPESVIQGLALPDEDIGYTALAQGIAGALHETQYTRLFRS